MSEECIQRVIVLSPEHEQIVIKTGSLSSSGYASDSPPGGVLYSLVALKEDIMSRGTEFSNSLAVGLLGGSTSLPHYLNIQVPGPEYFRGSWLWCRHSKTMDRKLKAVKQIIKKQFAYKQAFTKVHAKLNTPNDHDSCLSVDWIYFVAQINHEWRRQVVWNKIFFIYMQRLIYPLFMAMISKPYW